MQSKILALAEHLRFQTPIPNMTEQQAELQARDVLEFLLQWELKQLNSVLGDEVQQEPVRYMTMVQKAKLILLLEDSRITRPERTKIMLGMVGYTEERAEAEILLLETKLQVRAI